MLRLGSGRTDPPGTLGRAMVTLAQAGCSLTRTGRILESPYREDERRMPHSGQLGTTISLVMLGLVLAAVAVLPGRELAFTVLGSQLTVPLSQLTQLATVMIGLACSGADKVIGAHPLNRRRSPAYSAAFWTLPAVLMVACLYLVRELAWWGFRIGFVLGSGALLAVVIMAQYHTVDRNDPRIREARLALNVLAYALAVFFFVVIYGTRLRSVLSATGVLVVSGALATELLRTPREDVRRTWLYAGVIAMVMGEATWVLNYVAMESRAGGGLLLVLFYTLTGLVQQHLWRRLTKRVAIEYITLAVAGTVFVLASFGWL